MNAAPCLGSNEAKSKTNQKLNTLQTEGLQHTYICLCFVFLPQNMFLDFGFLCRLPKFEAAGHNNIVNMLDKRRVLKLN